MRLSLRQLLRLYLPLAASDLLLGASETAVNAGIARLAQPALSLAAYGAVIATALLIESPVIMLLHAANALATDAAAFRRLRRFTLVLAGVLTGLHALLAFTPLFRWYFGRVLGLEPEVLALARPSFALMLPWTGTIAWRRLHQGLLIRHGHTGVVGRGTLIRLLAIATGMALVGGLAGAPGAVAGGAGLAAGVTAECLYIGWVAARWMRESGWDGTTGAGAGSRPGRGSGSGSGTSTGAGASGGVPAGARPTPWASARAEAGAGEGTASPLSWRQLLAFYTPLALTSMTTFAARPVLTGLLARSADAPVGLAAWPVTWSTLLLFMLPMRTIEQITIPHAGTGAERDVQRFARLAGIAGSALLAALAATSLLGRYLEAAIGVTGPVLAAARASLLWLAPVPFIVTGASFAAGRLVRHRQTLFVHLAALANVGLLAVTALTLHTLWPALPGTRTAALSLIIAYLGEWAVLTAGAALALGRVHTAGRGPGTTPAPSAPAGTPGLPAAGQRN
ncbi:MAG TPA: hypothetical protein VIK92_02120 [Thermaerobacter sp.]